ncbi:MAG: hypothetical protein JNG88_17420 [Phycisphaerales bacterium]|nr:hypothetical protein [Phycisphaerales bacterium]
MPELSNASQMETHGSSRIGSDPNWIDLLRFWHASRWMLGCFACVRGGLPAQAGVRDGNLVPEPTKSASPGWMKMGLVALVVGASMLAASASPARGQLDGADPWTTAKFRIVRTANILDFS